MEPEPEPESDPDPEGETVHELEPDPDPEIDPVPDPLPLPEPDPVEAALTWELRLIDMVPVPDATTAGEDPLTDALKFEGLMVIVAVMVGVGGQAYPVTRWK